MCPTGIDLYGIAQVKVEFFRLHKIYVKLRLGWFVWTTIFEQCEIIVTLLRVEDLESGLRPFVAYIVGEI